MVNVRMFKLREGPQAEYNIRAPYHESVAEAKKKSRKQTKIKNIE